MNTAQVLPRAAAAVHRGWVGPAEMVVAMWPHGWPHQLHSPGSRLAATSSLPLPVIRGVRQLPPDVLPCTAALPPPLAKARTGTGAAAFNPRLGLQSRRPSQETSLGEARPLARLGSGPYSAALVCPELELQVAGVREGVCPTQGQAVPSDRARPPHCLSPGSAPPVALARLALPVFPG